MAEHVCGFPLFARLPPEIQYMIWEEALRTPQIVQLCFDFSKYNTTGALAFAAELKVNRASVYRVLRNPGTAPRGEAEPTASPARRT